MFGIKSKSELSRALAACRIHFIANFWFQGLVALAALSYPIYMIQVFERVVPSRNLASLLALLVGCLTVLFCSGVFSYVEKKLLLNASLRVDNLLSARVFTSVIERSSREQIDTGGQLIRDLGIVRAFYTRTAPEAIINSPWAVVFLSVLFLVNTFVGLVALALLVLEILVTAWHVSASGKAQQEAVQSASQSERIIESNLRSADAIVSMGMLSGLVRKWQVVDDRAVSAEAKGGRVSSLFSGLNSSLSMAMQVAILTATAVVIIGGQLGAGYAFAALIAFSFVMRPVKQVVSAWQQYHSAKASAERLTQLLERYPPSSATTQLPPLRGEVGVRRAVFYPQGASKPILNGVTFGIEPGTTVGIVGAIGSGKTTLVRLLVGLQRPSQGEVRLDGTEASAWDREQLGRWLGYLPQEIGLASATVTENISRFGQFTDAEAVEAAERAGVHNIILKLPNGYDTLIGEGGLRLSGGQRQLIGLARAVVGNPSLVILDEPNSNLDGPGETSLVECIASLKAAGATVIMVSHRPALVQNLDRVILLRDGTVAFDGSPDKFVQVSQASKVRLIKPVASQGDKSA